MSDGLLFTKVTNPLIEDNRSMMVWLWDLGPAQPENPKKPKAPAGKEGDPEYELAMVEFREALEAYTEDRKTYQRLLKEKAAWDKRHGGPIELQFWSCDAHDALDRAPERYTISSRTRGHEKAKNGGLPMGMKPGHGQAENMRRQAEGDADLVAARRRDPVFGEQEIRS